MKARGWGGRKSRGGLHGQVIEIWHALIELVTSMAFYGTPKASKDGESWQGIVFVVVYWMGHGESKLFMRWRYRLRTLASAGSEYVPIVLGYGV